MRELKFRYWDGEYMEYWSFEGKCCADIIGFEIDDVEIMQYTGLKDKNGVEIYEGDVVEYNQNFCKDENLLKFLPKAIGEIAYSEKYGQFNIVGWFGGRGFYENHKFMKVIGTIYENPELIN